MSGPPKEIAERLPHDPRLWARNMLRHPNDPTRAYDFYDDSGEEFLYYLVDDGGPMNPAQWGDINVLLFCRGGLKTWTTTTIAGWGVDCYPSLEEVATAPVDDQRGEVLDRFKEKVEQSGLVDRRVKDNMGHQKFRNVVDDGSDSYTSYSHLKSRSAWGGGDKLRGLHAHMGIIDEAQDVDEGTFSTFLEAIDRAVPQVDYFPTIFVIGTPKMANTFFHRLWRMSDQKTWDGEAKEWVQQDEPNEFLPEELQSQKEELEEKVRDLKEQDDPDEDLIAKFEAELDDIEGFTVRGWHLDQHNSPLHSAKDIAFKKETYSKRKFQNEVLANFYSPENDLLTNEDVWDAFVDERFAVEQQFPETNTYLGVDWGGGSGEGAANTVCIVAEETPDGGLHVDNVDIFDSDCSSKEEREQIDKYMRKYDVDIGVVDEGFGDTDREELQDEYGYDERGRQSIYGCWYGNVKDKEEIKWNRFNDRKRFFTTSKSFMVKQMAEDFKRGNVSIPKTDLSFDSKQSTGTMIVEQLTAPYTEKKETRGGKTKEEIVSERNDDVFDALTYVWIAANKVQSERTLKTIGSHSRPGYS